MEATGIEFEWDEQEAGMAAFERAGDPLPQAVLDSIDKTHLALKGPLTTPVGTSFRSVNVRLRQHFDTYANVRPAKSLPNTHGRFDGLDFILYRENTEGLYAGIEYFDERNQIADSIARITRRGSERIIKFAFEDAMRRGRKRLTLVHKANILKLTSGMFLDIGREMAKDYPAIEFDDRIVDNMAMQVVVNPLKYDVLVLPNLYGDILSDLCAGLVGGLGVVPGANHGEHVAVFEAVHGSAPDIAGQNIANPTALIRSGAMMLDHLGMKQEAIRVRAALDQVMSDRVLRTRDLGGEASTSEFADALVAAVESG